MVDINFEIAALFTIRGSKKARQFQIQFVFRPNGVFALSSVFYSRIYWIRLEFSLRNHFYVSCLRMSLRKNEVMYVLGSRKMLFGEAIQFFSHSKETALKMMR